MTQQTSTKLITIIGGGGYLGRYVVRKLAKTGARLRVADRNPNEVLFLRPLGDVGQIQLVQANIRNIESLRHAVRGADQVVNLAGVIANAGHNTFTSVHEIGAGNVAQACVEEGVDQLVHVSALGADFSSKSQYSRSKAAGEREVEEHFPDATIIRPSVLIGPNDKFFHRFATLVRPFPVVPVVGGGKTLFQLAYVGDVADAIVAALGQADTAGRIYELGGPKVWSLREVYDFVLETTRRERLLVPLPFFAAKFASIFLQMLPGKILRPDQVNMLREDNVLSGDAPGFEDLGIEPTPAETIMAPDLVRHRKSGHYDQDWNEAVS